MTTSERTKLLKRIVQYIDDLENVYDKTLILKCSLEANRRTGDVGSAILYELRRAILRKIEHGGAKQSQAIHDLREELATYESLDALGGCGRCNGRGLVSATSGRVGKNLVGREVLCPDCEERRDR